MASRLRRIYIDGRFRSEGTPSKFTYNIPGGSFEVPPQMVAVIDSFVCANTFKSVQDWNRRIYFRELSASGTVTDKWVELPLVNYNVLTLAAAVATALNSATTFQSGVLNDGNNTPDPPYFCEYVPSAGQLKISLKTIYDNTQNPPVQRNVSTQFTIWTREALQTGWTGTGSFALPVELDDASELMGSVAGTLSLIAPGSLQAMPEFPDVHPIKQLFIHSKALGHRSSLGPSGQTTIIKRVPVVQGYGETIHDTISTAIDHFDIGGSQLSQIDFEILDSNNRPIPLTRHASFSVLFIPLEFF